MGGFVGNLSSASWSPGNLTDGGLATSGVLMSGTSTLSVAGYISSTVKSTAGYGSAFITGGGGSNPTISCNALNVSGGGYGIKFSFGYNVNLTVGAGGITASGAGTIAVTYYYPNLNSAGTFRYSGNGTATAGACVFMQRANLISGPATAMWTGNLSANGAGSSCTKVTGSAPPVTVNGNLTASNGAMIDGLAFSQGPFTVVNGVVNITAGGLLTLNAGGLLILQNPLVMDNTSTYTNHGGVLVHVGALPPQVVNPGTHFQVPTPQQVLQNIPFGMGLNGILRPRDRAIVLS